MSISPDQFLTQPSDPDEDGLPLDVDFPLDQPSGSAMASIGVSLQRTAESLETIAQSFGANAELEDERNTLREAYADQGAQYESLFGLVADIEKLVSKSTSKLALSVKDAINGWKAGTVVEPEPVELAPEIVAASALNVSTIIEPDRDAPVEEWRAYAGGFELAEGINLEQMNRSQIRSVLGISQTASD